MKPSLLFTALLLCLLEILARPAAGQPGATGRVAARPDTAAPAAQTARRGGKPLTIRGHIAGQDARPVAQAAVALVSTALGATTDEAGDFTLVVPAATIGQLPDAPVRLRLSYPGYPARLVELAPRPADLVSTAQVTVTAGPETVQLVRTPAQWLPLARVSPPPPPPPPMAAELPPPPPAVEGPPVPAFPWPPPHPSAFCVLPGRFTAGGRQLSDVDARLRRALAKARFHDPAYYSIPGGFAMVTRIEQLDGQDDPLPEPNRWAPDAVAGSSLADFLSRLVRAHTGRFRVVVFAVTARAFAPTADTASKAEAMAWLRFGTASLPASLGRLPWTADSHCTALVYEFEKKENRAAALVEASQFSGQQHLAKAGIALKP